MTTDYFSFFYNLFSTMDECKLGVSQPVDETGEVQVCILSYTLVGLHRK